jgi:acyl-CoA reductase-like NAD-dependent aldehyde dehydrogenase
MNPGSTRAPDVALFAETGTSAGMGASALTGATDENDAARYCQDLIDAMLRHQDELIEALTAVATYDSAADEVRRSIRALAGARWELDRSRPEPQDLLGVFLPAANVLYSYTVMGLIPALYCRRVEIRPARRVRDVVATVHEILAPAVRGHDRGRIALTHEAARNFVRFCGEADGIISTGRHDDGLEIASRVSRRTKLLLFGSGPNPFVVGREAAIGPTVDDLLRSRLHNSGQDNRCPDAVFVRRDRLAELVGHLGERLAEVPVADRRDPGTRVTPLVDNDAIQDAAWYIDRNREQVRFGGKVDLSTGTVAPTIMVTDLHPGLRPPEFLAPIFLVCAYDDPAQIGQWATTGEELARGMYVSLYGEPGLHSSMIGTSIVNRDSTAFDIEDANRPFGGYGVRASSVHQYGELTAGPLLVSAQFGAGRTEPALTGAGTR